MKLLTMSVGLWLALSPAWTLLVPARSEAAEPMLDAVRISAEETLPGLSIPEQRELLRALQKDGGAFGKSLSAYYLPKDLPELSWIAPRMLELLYQPNARGSGSNCYWTSHFALGVIGLPERFMDLPEYLKLADGDYSRLDPAASQPQAGDILRLRRQRGNMDTHSVPYLGRLKRAPWIQLVLSKNGPADGPYLILSLSELTTYVYPGSRITDIYRKR